jgi:hypothetical protein
LLVEEEDVGGLAAALVQVASTSDRDYVAGAEHARSFIEEHHDARLTAKQIAAVYCEALGRSPSS